MNFPYGDNSAFDFDIVSFVDSYLQNSDCDAGPSHQLPPTPPQPPVPGFPVLAYTPVVPSNNLPLQWDLVNLDAFAAHQTIALEEATTAEAPEPPQPVKRKKAINGFFAFRMAKNREQREAQGAKLGFDGQQDLSNSARDSWRALTKEERDAWCEKAAEETRARAERESASASASTSSSPGVSGRRPRKATPGQSRKGKGKGRQHASPVQPSGLETESARVGGSPEEGQGAEARPAKRRRTQTPGAQKPEQVTPEAVSLLQIAQDGPDDGLWTLAPGWVSFESPSGGGGIGVPVDYFTVDEAFEHEVPGTALPRPEHHVPCSTAKGRDPTREFTAPPRPWPTPGVDENLRPLRVDNSRLHKDELAASRRSSYSELAHALG
ncbi:hypothetical protein PsYK624_136180 [Phanerochaete sordida]|uniref:Uncharacterized protein n=1 Tax=Phanerochaete sordida TaxID=48140 RepID=A0A9P3GLW1_9APHY|nr:hypothetical protein PsYK624_136180 [Phanerochaete sordida]